MPASESAPDAPHSSGAALGSRGAAASRRPRRRWPRALAGAAALAAWLSTAYWHTHKPLAAGERVGGDWYAVGPRDVRFIADVTAADGYGRRIESHAVFDEMLQVVGSAREFIVIDAYRFAADPPPDDSPAAARARPLAAELRDALIARKRAEPSLRVLFIADPVNVGFGAAPSADLERLERAGIDVVVTNLDPLRDSNFLYSSLWRLAAKWWLEPEDARAGRGGLPNLEAAGPSRVAAAAWLAAGNLKSDRRNLVIGDDGGEGLAGVLSATELSRAGSADSNVAIRLGGPVLVPLLRSELAIARFSGWAGDLGAPGERAVSSEALRSDPPDAPAQARGEPAIEARVLTESAIRDALLARIEAARIGDAIDIAAFYLSDRAIIEALVAASRRGAAVRLILDPGEDAFGRTGAGIPNRSVAGELLAASDGAIGVRWYRTHGERFHTGLVLIYGPRRLWLALGSANLTRRSLEDYDLDADAAVAAPRDSALADQAIEYFETLWGNRAGLGIEYTADVGVYADGSQLSYWRYRLMEATGLSMF